MTDERFSARTATQDDKVVAGPSPYPGPSHRHHPLGYPETNRPRDTEAKGA
jgi:hypothetical protein